MKASRRASIPRVAGLPLIGNARSLATDPAEFILWAGRSHGGLAEVRHFRRRYVVVTDPEAVRHILIGGHRKYRRTHDFGHSSLGEGLLSLDAGDWQKRRRQVGTVFRFEMLDRLMLLMREEVHQALDRWDDLARSGEGAPLADEIRRLVIRGLSRMMFSETPLEERMALAEAVTSGLRLTRRRNEGAFRFPLSFPTATNRHLLHTHRDLDALLQAALIDRRRFSVGDQPRDMIDALIHARDPEDGDPLSDGEIVAELKGLLAAGIDTTAEVLTRALEKLAEHPDSTMAWLSDVDRVFPRGLPERGDLPRLERLRQIVDETLRLYPPVPTLSRECVETDIIDGYLIPRGTTLLLSILAVHRDERYWPEPDEFRPGRFVRDWPRNAFLPFGAGSNACVANNFALTQILMTLAMIGQRFRISIERNASDERRGRNERRRSEPMLRLRPRA